MCLCWCKQTSKRTLYLLDTLLTVCVIHQLVVFYWRGVWEIFDVQLEPEDPHASAVICVIIAYTLQLLVCLLQLLANFLCRSKRSAVVRWAMEVIIFFFANLVGVSLWRGIWLLLDHYFLPDSPGLSAGITHLVGVVLLCVMLCAHSVALAGCAIDGESPVEESCLTPNYYLRLFFTQPRRNQVADVLDDLDKQQTAAAVQQPDNSPRLTKITSTF